MAETLDRALPRYLILVVGLAFILLVLVFRSLLVPLKATLGFLLSVAAAFGAVSVLAASAGADVSAVSFFAPQAVIATSINAASSKAIILLIVFSF